MPTMSFTNGPDSYTVTGAGTYDLSFLDGADTLTVDGGTFTTARMGSGDDRVTLRSGDASIFGNLGNDRFDIYTAGIEADGGDGADRFVVRGGNGLNLTGGAGGDRFDFLAASSNLVARGGEGNDRFYGNGQMLDGAVRGDLGNDIFEGFANRNGHLVALYGGLGDDTYRADALGTTIIEAAGQGTDTVLVARGQSFVLPDNVERLMVEDRAGSSDYPASLAGNGLNNVIVGSDSNVEMLFGHGGDDKLTAMGSGDSLYGGDGNDTLIGGSSGSLRGEAGNDTYYVNASSLTKVIEGAGGGTDTIRLSSLLFDQTWVLPNNVENVVQEENGDFKSFRLHGNDLDNKIIGSEGTDHLFGEGGNDIINGRAGADVIEDGLGLDRMTGGLGADLFRFWTIEGSPVTTLADFITDFHGIGSEGDKIDLHLIDADVGQADDQAFHYTGSAGNGDYGALWITTETYDGYMHIWGDVNGDFMPDFEIRIAGTVTIDDIIL